MTDDMQGQQVYAEFERKPPTEDTDLAEIVRDILITQVRYARTDRRPLGRGTHTKGIGVRAEFEVFDVRANAADQMLADRLARGIFGRPGVYPVVVRFANAESSDWPDSHPDVRALSFSIDVPPGLLGNGVSRLDFSMNTATTFPINDVHAFAVFVRMIAAANGWARAKALWAQPLRDTLGLFRTAYLAVRQQRQTPKLAYQQLRYWSTVPYRHGTGDAIKYSATPHPDNPAGPLPDGHDAAALARSGPNFLQAELTRHVNDDARMSRWDFGLQFLDIERMTSRGRHHDAPYWIENATVEWKESESPFHRVAELRLLPTSMLTPEETDARYIDVTTFSLPESRPIGGLNRGRWAAENASRRARLGEGVVTRPVVAPLRPSVLGRIARGAIVAGAAFLTVLLLLSVWYRVGAAANVPPLERADSVRYLDQGWGRDMAAPSRELYYYTPQGAGMHGIRYSWFVNLERPFRASRLADPDHMRQLDLIVDPLPSPSNPDLLPVGFSRRYDDKLGDDVVDITCAACHVGQLHVTKNGRRTAIRIDGGQAMNAFTDMKRGSLQVEIVGALATTLANPFKFNRFANRVLHADATISNKLRLWRQVAGVTSTLVSLGWRGSFDGHLYPTQEGYGRTDAVSRISNVVFGDHIDPRNYRMGNAPASFPYVWNIWRFNWVQYGAFVSQPMARNIGEVMGTGASYAFLDEFGRPVPEAERYRTTVQFENLHRIETTLQTLRPPRWEEAQDVLGPVDASRATAGEALFKQHCAGCHGPHVAADALTRATAPGLAPNGSVADPMWVIRVKALADIGTDPAGATNLLGYRLDLTRAGLDAAAVRGRLRTELEARVKRMEPLVPELTKEREALLRAPGSGRTTPDEIANEIQEAAAEAAAYRQELKTLDQLDLRNVSIGQGLTIFGMMVRDRYYADHHFSPEAQACFNGFDMLDLPQAALGYKPRPLEGVWATPPFLHNGSVPTIYDLLSPADERPKQFSVGTREYDPVHLGYRYATAPDGTGGFWFDTREAGNSNRGHEFNAGYVEFDDSKPAEAQYQNGLIGPRLTPEQRLAIVEYLKVHRDDPAGASRHVPPDCSRFLGGPTR